MHACSSMSEPARPRARLGWISYSHSMYTDISKSNKSCFGRSSSWNPLVTTSSHNCFLDSNGAWPKSRCRNRGWSRVFRQRLIRLLYDGFFKTIWFLSRSISILFSAHPSPRSVVRRSRLLACDVRRNLLIFPGKDCERRVENGSVVLGSWENTLDTGARRADGTFSFGWCT